MLAIVSFISMVVVVVTGHNKSIFDANAVSSKIQVLISFVFAGYIGIIVNRWDRVRNGTLGSVWGALENLNMFAYHIIDDNDHASHEEKEQLKDCLLRLTRLVFQLVFLAVQGESNLKPLIEMKLLTEKEMLWLDEAVLGTRPLIVVDWMYSYFFTILKKKNYHISDPMEQHLLNEIKGLRGGVGATLGCIGSQLPYPYVHGVYWTIEVLLMSMGIEQGVWLGTDIWMKSNGEGKWKDPRPGHQWPEDPDVWYGNAFLQIVASNIIFALFCEGMLKVCDKLSNPMSRDETSFSEYVFGKYFPVSVLIVHAHILVLDAFLHNNCRALRVGATAFREVLGNDLEDLIQRRHIQKDDLLD
jgi:hypothetical protein